MWSSMSSAVSGLFDVGDRHLGVPAVVDMDGQRIQAELLDLQRDIGAVDPAADPDEAIESIATPVLLHVTDQPFDFRATCFTG